MTRADFLRSAALLIVAWLLVSLAASLWGEWLMTWLTPWLAYVAEQVMHGFDAYLVVKPLDGAAQIEIAARATIPVEIADGLTVPPGATVTAGSHVSHALIPVVVLVALLVAWPAASLRTRLQRLALALLVGVALISVTTPLLLAGKIDMFFIETAAREGLSREPGPLVAWAVFTEMGGRWLLPLLAAAVVMLATRRQTPSRQREHPASASPGNPPGPG